MRNDINTDYDGGTDNISGNYDSIVLFLSMALDITC